MAGRLLEILTELHDHGVDFVIAGGVAGVLHGSSRVTFDLDIVPSLAPDSWRAAVDLLWALGARPRIPEPLERIRDVEHVRRWRVEKNMLALNLRTPDGTAEVDLLVAESDGFEPLRQRAVEVTIDERTFSVASIDDLIEMKQRSARPQDRLDITDLRNIQTRLQTRLDRPARTSAGAAVNRRNRCSSRPSTTPDELLKVEGSVLGIDIGWSETSRTSAVCRLSWDDRHILWKTDRFRATTPERHTISRVAGENALLAVAIDGPLRQTFDSIGRYRSAERLLSRGVIRKRIGKPGQSSSPNGRKLNAEANKTAEFVRRRCRVSRARHAVRIDEFAIVEAFPTTFLGAMIEDPPPAHRHKRSDAYFAHLAERQSFDRLAQRLLSGHTWIRDPGDLRNHDDRAAFVCALTALAVAAGEFTAVGDERDGWIILPPRWAFADWAWTAANETARDEQRKQRSESRGRLLSFPDNQPPSVL